MGDTLISNLFLLAVPVSLVHNLISAKNTVLAREETRGGFKVEITAGTCLWDITLTEELTLAAEFMDNQKKKTQPVFS